MGRKRAETQTETIVLCLTKNMKEIFGHCDTEKVGVIAVRGDNELFDFEHSKIKSRNISALIQVQ